MAAAAFDDDLFDFGVNAESSSAGSAEPDDSLEAGAVQDGVEQEGEVASDVPPGAPARRPRRRRQRCGSGSSQVGNKKTEEKRWCSGAVPPAPTFEGNVEEDPYCLRHYRRRLRRWVLITREFLPPNEQALRALEQLRGEAELELEEVPDSKFDCADGVEILLKELEVSFGERELFRQGGVVREFENLSRVQGESVTAFVRRFRLLERKLQDNKIPLCPEQARVVKLLDGLRLDERATSALLLAAGNRYHMQSILESIRVQYPAGMSITGVPKGLATLAARTSRSASSRSSSSARSSGSANSRRSRVNRWTRPDS